VKAISGIAAASLTGMADVSQQLDLFFGAAEYAVPEIPYVESMNLLPSFL